MTAQVQIIAGPARCGKTQLLLDEYRQSLAATADISPGRLPASCCWLAPNQTAANQIQASLLESADMAILRPNLFTFASFAESIITRSRRRVRAISQLQKRRLLQQVIREALQAGSLEHFARVAATPGFVAQLDENIAELKRTDTWPEEYQRRCQQHPRSERRSREISLLYSAYQQLLHQGELYDAEGRFWAAREILAAASSHSQDAYDLIVVNGFNDFTTAQHDILRLLGERSRRMIISLTLEQAASSDESDHNHHHDHQEHLADWPLLFAKTQQTLALLRQTFPQLEIDCQSSEPSGDRSLRTLQHQIFRELAQSEQDTSTFVGVEIVAASSELGEIEAIAGAIKSLLFAKQTRPSEIVVVHRGGEEATGQIAAVFPDYGIPFAAELRPRLETEPLVRALDGLFRLLQQDWPFQTLLEVVGNRIFKKFDAADDEATSFATRPRIAIESCLRSAQLPSGKAALLEQLEYRAQHPGQSESSEAQQRARQAAIAAGELRQLDELLSAQPAEGSLHEWLVALEQLLTRLGAFESAETSRSRAAATWRLLRRGIREIGRIGSWSEAEPKLTHAEMQELVATVAREQRVPAAHDDVGRVRILSAESARKLSVEHLFLAGLNEQSFSEPSGQQTDPASASELVPPVESDATDQPTEANVSRSDSMLLFYELLTRPTQSLTLSYPALDSKGQPLSPSPLLTELERGVGLGRIPHRKMTMGQTTEAGAIPLSKGNFRRQSVEQALAGQQQWLAGMISQPAFVRTGSSVLAGIECVAERGERETFGAYEGLVLSDQAKAALAKRFDGEHLWSPSRLESYAACPFRFFAERLLKVEPLNELTLSNDARRRGSLLHQVLATIHEQLGREFEADTAQEADSQELVRRFLAALDAAVKATPLRGIDQSLREIERREIEAWVPSYAEQETSYRSQWKHLDQPPRPAHFEVRFGPENRHSADEPADRASTPLPFELDLGAERIRLTGQIDRVDIGQVGGVTVFNIIDYKSGKEVRLKHEKVRSGHQLQLPLYALAAERLLLAEQEALALATGYWNIQGKGFQTKNGGSLQLRELADQSLQMSQDWQNLQPEILARVQQLITGIRQGDFPVYNQDEQCTRSCALSTMCRISQIRSLEKVWPPEEITTSSDTRSAPTEARDE